MQYQIIHFTIPYDKQLVSEVLLMKTRNLSVVSDVLAICSFFTSHKGIHITQAALMKNYSYRYISWSLSLGLVSHLICYFAPQGLIVKVC